MKLIQKKCPKCDAPLSFEENAETAVCEYCKHKISITRKNSGGTSEDFILSIEDFYKKRYDQTRKTQMAVYVIAIIIGICSFVFLIKMFSSANETPINSDIPVKEKKYITEISQLDENTLNNSFSKSLESLMKRETESSLEQTEWERVGIYLLNHKETKQLNLFYDVYQKEYKSSSGTVTVYAVVEFKNLEISENGTLDNYRVGSTYCPSKRIDKEYICGYDTLEDFFNEVIRNQTDKYKVTSTEGIYLEKIGN